MFSVLFNQLGNSLITNFTYDGYNELSEVAVIIPESNTILINYIKYFHTGNLLKLDKEKQQNTVEYK